MKKTCTKDCECKKEIDLLRSVLQERCELCKDKDCSFCRVTWVLKRCHNNCHGGCK